MYIEAACVQDLLDSLNSITFSPTLTGKITEVDLSSNDAICGPLIYYLDPSGLPMQDYLTLLTDAPVLKLAPLETSSGGTFVHTLRVEF